MKVTECLNSEHGVFLTQLGVRGTLIALAVAGGVLLAAVLYPRSVAPLQPAMTVAQEQAAAPTPSTDGKASETTLTVVGDIEDRLPPDMATVSLGVQTTGATAGEANHVCTGACRGA